MCAIINYSLDEIGLNDNNGQNLTPIQEESCNNRRNNDQTLSTRAPIIGENHQLGSDLNPPCKDSGSLGINADQPINPSNVK